ncbi:hypothetical protein, partial [Vibrio parahaemolyticus]|uniref:hypothetical protein n=1 Tax=Vibrio parahaemolyticus TaxID=670 RepID=UPI001A8E47D1
YIEYGHLLAEGSISEIIKQSELTTWLVTGDDLMELASVLKKLPGVDQVAFFGNKLHVSGKNTTLLDQSMHEFKNPNWHKIPAGLED